MATVSSTPLATVPAPLPAPVHTASGARALLPAGWPLYVLFLGYPLWWALGLQILVFPLVGIVAFFWLAKQRRVLVPRGFGIWLLFLLWMMVTSVGLNSADRIAAFVYRGSLYFTATLLLLYVFNLPRERMPTSRIVFLVVFFWGSVVSLGMAGVLLPGTNWVSLGEMLLPRGVASVPFVRSLIHPGLSDYSILLGYEVPRPRAPFGFTNEWGSNVGLLSLFAVYALFFLRHKTTRLLLAAALLLSLVPIIVSINRGLWISIIVGVLYVAVRVALRGHAKVLAGLLAVLAIAAAVVVFSPLSTVIVDRLTSPPNTTGRENLYTAAIAAALESPLLGYGAPQPSANNPSGPSVGTHGQLWTLMVSHGFPGLALFIGFFAFVLARSRKTSLAGLWPHAVVVVGLVQMPFYNMVPMQLHLIMIAVALISRDLADQSEQRDRGRGRRHNSETVPTVVSGASAARPAPVAAR